MASRFRTPVALLSVAAITLAAAGGCRRQQAAPPAPVADAEARRSVAQGELSGALGGYGSHVWLGVPFARPPVGERRWRAPEPPEPWTGTREALAHASACPQFASSMGGDDSVERGEPVGAEDCLYLNVYAPRMSRAEAEGERLPVMVWIHGGGNTIGSAATYDGGRLAQTHRVIVVTTQYRLGPFGWLRHPALNGADVSAADRSGN
jgi:para-nitrobenzyl esterase